MGKEQLYHCLQAHRTEMDVVMYVVRCENGNYFGITDSLTPVSISQSCEILKAQENSVTLATSLKPAVVDDMSQDTKLYDRLLAKNGNKSIEKHTAAASSLHLNAHLEEGRIFLFSAV